MHEGDFTVGGGIRRDVSSVFPNGRISTPEGAENGRVCRRVSSLGGSASSDVVAESTL